MKDDKDEHIDWNYSGKTNLLFGTGANASERMIVWASSFVVPLFFLYAYFFKELQLTPLQLVIGLFVAVDIGGGMVANSLNSCKRFYHSLNKSESKIERMYKNHFLFSCLHIHPIIIWLVFDPSNWENGLIWYGLFITAVLFVLKAPLYLKRPISMLMILLAIMINEYALYAIPGFGWLMPVLFIKIIYGHLVKEEPYRPIKG
ncbi:hypothetical protein CHH83_12180 [Bacillus sp. 7586-K]|uniref:hypothetical protein n=1 Tax=Metabacillus niabensis TaxID=324854 RepID=UPI000BA50EC9|nr:hypothetical protein CHH83_12180 [Bacillus sp. 7586-K]